MKSNFSIAPLLYAIAVIGVIASGCNQSNDQQSGGDAAETKVAAASEDACCEDCESQTVAAKTEDCCGKCGGETTTAKTKECCGKCAEELTAAKKETAGTEKCDACAKGDTENCQCSDVPADKGSSIDQANSQVNSMPQDRDIFHFLLQNHTKITRKVTDLENGVQTVTESTDAAIAGKIQEHVASMYRRVEDGRPLRMWDDLYREIFQHADKIKMTIKNTPNGISVIETSDDPYVVKLIQSHAKVVTGFTKRGFEEAHENHTPPKK